MDFSLWKLMPAGASRAALRTARPAVYQASGGAQVASPQSPILRWSNWTDYQLDRLWQGGPATIPVLIAQTRPVLIAPRHQLMAVIVPNWTTEIQRRAGGNTKSSPLRVFASFCWLRSSLCSLRLCG